MKMNEKLVLVVDDERDIVEIVCELLQGAGYQTTVAYDGRQALEKIAHRQPDLIVTDIKMPLVDGLQILEHVRADPSLASIPVIILTATQVMREARERFRKLGIYGWIAKPFEPEELLATVEQALGEETHGA